MCSPECTTAACPTDVPEGTSDTPSCVLEDQSSGKKYCPAVPCRRLPPRCKLRAFRLHGALPLPRLLNRHLCECYDDAGCRLRASCRLCPSSAGSPFVSLNLKRGTASHATGCEMTEGSTELCSASAFEAPICLLHPYS